MIVRWILAAAFLFLGTGNLLSQPAETEHVLVPVLPATVRGAFGSEWVTTLAVANVSPTPALVFPYGGSGPCTVIICGQPNAIPPAASIVIRSMLPSSEVTGGFLDIPRGRASDLAFTLRVLDTSRGFETWGVVIPIVRFDALFAKRFDLGDIPVGGHFRTLLRLYDVTAATKGSVRVRVYQVNPSQGDPWGAPYQPDVLLTDFTPSFATPISGGGAANYPGYFELSLESLPEVVRAQRVRVEIEPLDGRQDYWGFVSVTDNNTQHVTVITP